MHDCLPRWFLSCNADIITSSARCWKGKRALRACDQQRLGRWCIDTTRAFDRHHHARTACNANRKLRRAAVELSGAAHVRIGDPRFICFPFRQRREAKREHCFARRCDDELTLRTAHGNMPRARVAEDAGRRALVRKRVMEGRRPDTEPDGRGRCGDREHGGGRGEDRAARTQWDDVGRLAPRGLEDAPAKLGRRSRPPRRRRKGSKTSSSSAS